MPSTPDTRDPQPRTGLLALLGPGILVAATGVGAGDLATGAFTGSVVGVGVLWAVLLGAALKFALTEGLARWQLATGSTLLEGASRSFGLLVALVFLPYLLAWSFFVGAALMSACGATFHAIAPVFEDPVIGKRVFGVGHSLVGVLLVLYGGFPLFARVMSACIVLLFVTVLWAAAALWPGTSTVLQGLFLPDLVSLRGEDLRWTIALMGGVGGTVTILCYGYWIREQGREGAAQLRTCRIDLAVAYALTAVFGVAMVIVGSTIEVEGRGAALLVALSTRLETSLGTMGSTLFLLGAWAAVFSSLLGVWQSVPYLFADTCRLLTRSPRAVDGGRVSTRSVPYRGYLLLLASVPTLGLFYSFREIQQWYAIAGAAFMPLLALVLLLMNGRNAWIGEPFRNRWLSNCTLTGTLLFFAVYGWLAVR